MSVSLRAGPSWCLFVSSCPYVRLSAGKGHPLWGIRARYCWSLHHRPATQIRSHREGESWPPAVCPLGVRRWSSSLLVPSTFPTHPMLGQDPPLSLFKSAGTPLRSCVNTHPYTLKIKPIGVTVQYITGSRTLAWCTNSYLSLLVKIGSVEHCFPQKCLFLKIWFWEIWFLKSISGQILSPSSLI